MRALPLCLLLGCGALLTEAALSPPALAAPSGKKKHKKPSPSPSPVASPTPEPSPSESPSPSPTPAAEDLRPANTPQEAPLAPGERKVSRVTPGSASRWSNRGAMVPVVAEVEISAPLPERAVPLEAGQATPGQRLISDGERLSAHLSLYGEHVHTVRQDALNLDLLRTRATLHYDRILGSEFGAHVDLEYRANAGSLRLTDRRITQLYASWGLTDFRRPDGPSFGVALGRVAIREAGWAQADGAAIRLRVLPELRLGAFGGFAGNPYNYSWAAHQTQDFTTGWINAGLFGALDLSGFFANLAVSLSYANAGKSGLDRLYAYLDAGWSATEALDFFLTGWLDFLPNGTPFQNLELVGNYQPDRNLALRFGLARFATVVYQVSTDFSFRFDPTGSTIGTGVAVDANGNPIVSFDGKLTQTVYNELSLRGGYRIGPVEPWAAVSAQIREGGDAAGGFVPVAAIRLLPTFGATFRDPDLFELSAAALFILDGETDRKASLSLALNKTMYGFTVGGDLRAYLGGQGALEGGLEANYALPRELLPGRLLLRVMLRYYREDVSLVRPPDICLGPNPPGALCGVLADGVRLPVIPLQESFSAFGGVDWRY
ncbi:MAG: hypothetical protein U1E65_03935 [Myxococcota bacterium]